MGWCARSAGILARSPFIDLRDRDGITQIVCNEEKAPRAHAKAKEVRGEYVLAVTGNVVLRMPALAILNYRRAISRSRPPKW